MNAAMPNGRNAGGIKVVGVGDVGGKAVDRIAGEPLNELETIAVNTYDLALENLKTTSRRLSIGNGLGVGGNLMQGQRAAERSAKALAELLAGSTEVYVVAGMGGGTGSGAAPVVAQMAWEAGATVTAVVTRAFGFEGTLRASTAARGIALMEQRVHRLVVFNADRLLPFLAETPALDQAYALLSRALAWQVLSHMI